MRKASPPRWRSAPRARSSASTGSPALALSKGLDRDRAVEETGGQIAVFGRIGSRPFNRPEMEKLFVNSRGIPWSVSDEPVMADWLAPAPGTAPAAVARR